jgi:hypothetical protein
MEQSTPVPPVVYLPCESFGEEELDVTAHETQDGRFALLVYSALDRLIACCGPHQPWVLMPTKNLDRIGEHVHFDLILFDIEIPEEIRRKAA